MRDNGKKTQAELTHQDEDLGLKHTDQDVV